ncbi:histidine phosphatase family protein [uncultured Jatrophihabitans sp.]|uniref:histidine phosphatase family protein n=1 Tax=uncultured Jatrophihabitans sp. TaxID=1610747 RepID=UPI0035CC6B2E
MGPRRVVVLRHGRTTWNAERRFQGHADPPLDDVGRMQAYEVGEILAAIRPDVLVSSDAQRAAQTADIVGAAIGLPVLLDHRLRERGLGHWEGLTRDEVAQQYPDEYADWVAGRDVSRRGGESREEVAARVLAAFAQLPSAQLALLVTHSATAMALTNGLLGIPQSAHPLGPLANCHWTELIAEQHEGDEPRWRLRGHNLGVPGVVVPLPVREPAGEDETSDADA